MRTTRRIFSILTGVTRLGLAGGNIRMIAVMILISGLLSGISSAQYTERKTIENQPDFQWPEGKKMGLSLTFDDARLTQIDKGIPLLDKYGVKATFYISPAGMKQRTDGWIRAVSNGHDIGNHSVLHPCSGNFTWSRQKALEDYTLDRMHDELDSANSIIQEMLGVTPVSFGYPCGQKFVGRGTATKSYVPLIAEMFETGRGWLDEGPNDPAFCDMAKLYGMELDGKSFDEILKLIESVKAQGAWLILAGHEMNDGGNQTSLLSTIEALCKYATDTSNGIWIENVHTIASYINNNNRNELPKEYDVAIYGGTYAGIAAGVSYSAGRESNSEYGKTLNGVQSNKTNLTLLGTISRNNVNHNFIEGVDPYLNKGDPSSGLLTVMDLYKMKEMLKLPCPAHIR